jgi:hypothetical protein
VTAFFLELEIMTAIGEADSGPFRTTKLATLATSTEEKKSPLLW